MKFDIKSICEISIFTALLAVCAWISIPFIIPLTLQTFAVFLACLVLGGKKATVCLGIYIFLGAVGVPVFSAFGAGIGVLFGSTGGYISGFLLTSLFYWLVVHFFGNGNIIKITGCIIGMTACYVFGTLWYIYVYAESSDVTLSKAVSACVLPFIVPDILKLWLAFIVYRRILPHVKLL